MLCALLLKAPKALQPTLRARQAKPARWPQALKALQTKHSQQLMQLKPAAMLQTKE
jgi:hypothetical protein